MKFNRGILILGLCVCFAAPARAQDTPAALRSALVEAIRAKDARALAALFADSAVQLRGDSPPLVGAGAVGTFYATMFAGINGPNPFELRPQRSFGNATWVVEYGHFGPTSGPDIGGYVLTLRRGASGWQIWSYQYGRALAAMK